MSDSRQMAELEKLMRALTDKLSTTNVLPSPASEVSPEKLRQMYERLMKSHTFKPGDVVRWKPGFKDRKRPLEGQPAIVVKRLEKPVFDSTVGAGSPSFNTPYDLVLGVIDEDGDFLTYHFCSDRFEPYDA